MYGDITYIVYSNLQTIGDLNGLKLNKIVKEILKRF